MVSTRRFFGICTILHRLQYFDHRDEGRFADGGQMHVTDGDHPYMNNWWVPGLQIGYEQRLFIKWRIFWRPWRRESCEPDFPGRAGDAIRLRRGFEIRQDGRWEKVPAANQKRPRELRGNSAFAFRKVPLPR